MCLSIASWGVSQFYCLDKSRELITLSSFASLTRHFRNQTRQSLILCSIISWKFHVSRTELLTPEGVSLCKNIIACFYAETLCKGFCSKNRTGWWNFEVYAIWNDSYNVLIPGINYLYMREKLLQLFIPSRLFIVINWNVFLHISWFSQRMLLENSLQQYLFEI
jgi:hypothetical protein